MPCSLCSIGLLGMGFPLPGSSCLPLLVLLLLVVVHPLHVALIQLADMALQDLPHPFILLLFQPLFFPPPQSFLQPFIPALSHGSQPQHMVVSAPCILPPSCFSYRGWGIHQAALALTVWRATILTATFQHSRQAMWVKCHITDCGCELPFVLLSRAIRLHHFVKPLQLVGMAFFQFSFQISPTFPGDLVTLLQCFSKTPMASEALPGKRPCSTCQCGARSSTPNFLLATTKLCLSCPYLICPEGLTFKSASRSLCSLNTAFGCSACSACRFLYSNKSKLAAVPMDLM